MDTLSPKYNKFKTHPSSRTWRTASRSALRKITARWRTFICNVLFILTFTLMSRYFQYRRAWDVKLLTGANLEPVSWGDPSGVSTYPKETFFEKLSNAHQTVSCLNSCPPPVRVTETLSEPSVNQTCPPWFQYILEDLAPWMTHGIDRRTFESARPMASLHVIISRGRLYVRHFFKCPESREMFTLWGIANLLRKFPQKVPDLELYLDCSDAPPGHNVPAGIPPSPLFRYKGSLNTSDLSLPDWSFWGWPEAGLKSWDLASWQLVARARRQPWRGRKEVAHWKGFGGQTVDQFLGCKKWDWYRMDIQNLGPGEGDELQHVPRHDPNQLMDQLDDYRYKIFPGVLPEWSVSLKYFLSLGSVTLVPPLGEHNFFSRGLMPGKHFWPIHGSQLCKSISFAVRFGNSHVSESLKLASGGQSFAQEDLSLDRVYDYMLHLFVEYSKLLRFKPKVPRAAYEICPEVILCLASPQQKLVLKSTYLKRSSRVPSPCSFEPVEEGAWKVQVEEKDQVLKRIVGCESRGSWNFASCKLHG